MARDESMKGIRKEIGGWNRGGTRQRNMELVRGVTRETGIGGGAWLEVGLQEGLEKEMGGDVNAGTRGGPVGVSMGGFRERTRRVARGGFITRTRGPNKNCWPLSDVLEQLQYCLLPNPVIRWDSES